MAPSVRVDLTGTLAHLHAWGRDPSGAWWALASWAGTSSGPDGGQRPVRRSAWFPARTVHASTYAGVDTYRTLVRLALGPDPEGWPWLHVLPGNVYEHLGRVTAPIDRNTANGSAYG